MKIDGPRRLREPEVPGICGFYFFAKHREIERMKTDEFCRALQDKLAGRPIKIQNETDFFPSAVVVPLLTDADGQLAILFEVRSSQLAWQPGEICFPGGRIEHGDTDPQQAAVREAYEELGLPAGGLRLLGPLDYLVSPIGVIIYPFAGFIPAPARIRPNAEEVAEIFTVPLRFLLTAEPLVANMEVATRPMPGFPLALMPAGYPRKWRRRALYSVLFYQYENRVIWGLTARMLSSFVQICRSMDAAW